MKNKAIKSASPHVRDSLTRTAWSKLSTFRPKVCCHCLCPRTWGRPFNQSPRDYKGVQDACCVNLCQKSSCWVWPININKFTAFQISFKNLGTVTVYCIVYLHPIRNLILSCQQTKTILTKNPLQNIEGHCMHCLKHANKITVTSLNVANYQAHNEADTADRNSKAFRATHAWYFRSNTSGWLQCVFYCSVSRLSYFKMAHNYIVTAHKPTAVSACETGKKSRFGYILCMFFRCVLYIILQNSFAPSMAPPNWSNRWSYLKITRNISKLRQRSRRRHCSEISSNVNKWWTFHIMRRQSNLYHMNFQIVISNRSVWTCKVIVVWYR